MKTNSSVNDPLVNGIENQVLHKEILMNFYETDSFMNSTTDKAFFGLKNLEKIPKANLQSFTLHTL